MSILREYTHYFMPHIFARGEAIAETDAVEIIINNDKVIEAEVEGTELYDVRIEVVGKSVDMYCSCPYAESGENCKHMAAVLIVADSTGVDSGDNQEPEPIGYQDQLERIKDHMATLDMNRLIDFFAPIVLNDDAIKRSYIAQFDSDDLDPEDMIDDFQSIVDHYMGYEGFINYRRAGDFFKEIDDFLDDVDVMLKDGLAVECAKIISAITLGFDELPMDDSDGHCQYFYEHVIEITEKILAVDNPEANEILYKWMDDVNLDPDSWYLVEWLQPIWQSRFSGDELLDMEIDMLERKLLGYGDKHEDNVSSYGFITTLMDLVRVKEQRGDKDDEIKELLRPYSETREVIRYLVKKAQAEGDSAEEERLLKCGLEQSRKRYHYGYYGEFEEALCNFYKRMGMKAKYSDMLRELVIKSHGDLAYYREFKALFDEKAWQKEKKKIIRAIESKSDTGDILAEIFVEEKMMDSLLKWLKKGRPFEILRKYSEYLIDDKNEEILNLLIESVDEIATKAGSVRHYEGIVGRMVYIQSLPGGRPVMARKAREYDYEYRRRPNFIKELRKVDWRVNGQ